jgi:murein tripeptide amidase MpaA
MQRPTVLLALVLSLWAAPLSAQTAGVVPTPASHFGFTPGEDRRLANWDELVAYYEKVAEASPRVSLDTLGQTTGGKPFVMFTITSPENHARLAELHDVQLRLADPRRVGSPEELARLKEEAKTIVLVTSNVHSTEVGAGQMPANLVYRLASSDDPDVLEILDRVILLHIPSLNPDGTHRWSRTGTAAGWAPSSRPSPGGAVPPYIGHDNNRTGTPSRRWRRS